MGSKFPGTRWTLVQRAGAGGRQALQELCEAYWYPLYAYVRRQGYSPEDAQDLTQGFFTMILERNDLKKVRRERGRFRSYLLGAMSNFLSNNRERANAQKRGGGVQPLSLDWAAAEGRFKLEPTHDLTAEKLFHRHWTLTLLDRVLARLREEYVAQGKQALFDQLRGSLTGDGSDTYREIGGGLGMKEGAVKVAAHRMRKRYRELLREEVEETVGHPDAVDDEIRELLSAL